MGRHVRQRPDGPNRHPALGFPIFPRAALAYSSGELEKATVRICISGGAGEAAATHFPLCEASGDSD
jgi:hypothetical protein